MAWNHKSRVVAMAIAIQPVAGTFTVPVAADIIPVAPPTNGEEIISTEDNTATGTVWNSPRVYLGKTGTAGATLGLRGHGGAVPPALNAWPVGRLLQAAGFTEIRVAAATNPAIIAGSTTTAFKLAATESAVDDFMIGYVIQHASIGAAGTVKGTSVIVDYDGAGKLATIGETVAVAPVAATQYVLPAQLIYVLGTLTTAPPLLSVTIWRDKKRYDYKDVRLTSLMIDMPVSNEQNQAYPSLEFQMKGLIEGVTDVAGPPAIPPATLAVPIPPFRGGKYALDKVRLGHASTKFGISAEVAGASNANADAGQDVYEIMSGQRTLEMDLNQMAVTDLNLDSRVDSQTVLSQISIWGGAVGNRFAFSAPEHVLDPINNPGDRNGFVNLTGNAAFTGVDKSATLTVF